MTELDILFLGFIIGFIFGSITKNKPNKINRNDEFYH